MHYNNLTKSGSISWNPGYNPANNHYSLAGTSYDANGNLKNDTIHQYTWDEFGKLKTVDSSACGTNGECITYDALGRSVEISNGSVYTEVWYTQLGKTAYMQGSALSYAYWPTPGGDTLLQTHGSGYSYYFQHKDWLGSARISSTLGATIIDDRAFAPYGEMYQNFGSTSSNELIFTGDTQDIAVGIYDTPNRELNASQGRWLSPDPAGASWNAYAYGTNPNSVTDPSGLIAGGPFGGFHSCPGGFNGCFNFDLQGQIDYSDLDGLNAALTSYVSSASFLQQFMDNVNNVVTAVFRPELQTLNWALSNFNLFQTFIDSGMADTRVTVGWFKNTVLNPWGHIAMGVGDNPLVGLNPVSDVQFAAFVAVNTVGCLGGVACNPLAMTEVPGVVSEEDPSKVSVDSVTYSISAEQGIAIETGIELSRANPPNYSIQGPLPACDCGSWAQQILGFGGIPSGPPTWRPETLMQQLEQP